MLLSSFVKKTLRYNFPHLYCRTMCGILSIG
nr:MAG TPA: hypothetical protein [Caudoviricetes sp.]